MADIITTLHPENQQDNLYPNVKKENIPDGSIDDSKLDQAVKDKILNLENSKANFNTLVLQALPPEINDKKSFYKAVNESFTINKEGYTRVLLNGTPEELQPFFDIWGKPVNFGTTIHAYVVIQMISNAYHQTAFEMKLFQSSSSKSWGLIIHGYNGQYVGSTGWLNPKQIALVDGSYDEMSVGSANSITSRPIFSHNEFIKRKTYDGASFDNGVARIVRILGNTMKSTNKFTGLNGAGNISVYDFEDSTYSINGTGNVSIYFKQIPQGTKTITIKVLRGSVTGIDEKPTGIGLQLRGGENEIGYVHNGVSITTDSMIDHFWVHPSATYTAFAIQVQVVDGALEKPFTQYFDGLQSAKPTALSSSKDGGGITASKVEIAPEIQALEDYGLGLNDFKNEVDLSNKRFIRRVKGLTLNGVDEIWQYGGSISEDIRVFAINLNTNKLPQATIEGGINLISDYIDLDNQQVYQGEQGIAVIGNYITLHVDAIKEISELKEWLKNKPINLVYIMKEPETINLPVEQDNNYAVYQTGFETWQDTVVPVPCDIYYPSNIIGKAIALPTRPEYDAKQSEQDRRIKALEDRLSQLIDNQPVKEIKGDYIC